MRYLVTHAINALYPHLTFSMTDPTDIETLHIQNGDDMKVDPESIEVWLFEKNSNEPMRLLREERNRRLSAVDWVVIKYVSMGTALPEEWATYMQQLRELPSVSNPQLTADGKLDMASVQWPVQPSL